MRSTITLVFFLQSFFCFSQTFEKVKTGTEEYYLLNFKDIIDLNQKFPDGRWKIIDNNDSLKRAKFVFWVKNNKVTGSFFSMQKESYTYGNYYYDSLWTFLTHPNDTTFKIGEWYTYNYVWTPYSEHYKIPFDKDSLFVENWWTPSGKQYREAIHKKGFGIVKETFWNSETGNISRQTTNSTAYSKTEQFKNDSIDYISVSQNGIDFTCCFDYPFFSKNKKGFNFQISKKESAINSDLIGEINVDESGSIKAFNDKVNHIYIRYNKNGDIVLEYRNKAGKLKTKILK